MSKAVPWSIKGVDFDAREAAKEAARRDGVTLGEWINRAIVERGAETGSNIQDFDADERLEAVAAQLARLSRRSEDEAGSRPTAERGRERAPVWTDEENEPVPVRNEVLAPERGARRRPPREPVAVSSRETAARPLRDSLDSEALLEKAVAAFEARAGRVEARTARALSDVADRIESAESQRADMLAQVDTRLADLETHLRKKARSNDVEPLRGALDRLESRIEDLASREPESRDDETLRKLDRKLSNILVRVERAETAPAAERDEHFARLEKRFDALLARLDRPAPPRGPASPPGRLGDLQGAIEQISARQLALDAAPAPRPQPSPAAPAARPSAPPAARPPAFDDRFDALARKLERMAELNAAPREDRRIDALQNGIEALSSRIEAMRRDFAGLQGAARDTATPNVEKALRDLTARVETLAASQSSTALKDVSGMRGELAGLTRTLGELAPRGAVAGLESAMRDLTNRVETTRNVVQRVAETQTQNLATPNDDVQALSRQLAEISRGLHDVAPRGAVAGVESAMRELGNRVDSAREIMARASERSLDSAPDFEALNRQLAEIGRSLGEVAPRGAVTGLEQSVRDLSDRVDSARAVMERATPVHAAVGVAEIEALGQQVAAMGQALSNVAPRSQIAGLELAVRDLSERVERSRDEGLRDSVLAPIEHLAADVRRALAETGASADFERVVRQMHALENKIDDLRGAGGADRADFLHACDQSDQLRASIATALEGMAPLELMEKQVASLTDRLEALSRQSIEASRAQASGLEQTTANWREIGSRLDDLAIRIDRAADLRQESAPGDEHRFDELSRRLDFMHQALAERIDGAAQARGQQSPQVSQQNLEPLLRALADRLENVMSPQADGRAIEALERQVSEVSERLERGASHSNIQLQQALGDLAARLDQQRDSVREAARETLLEAMAHLPVASRDEQAVRDIAELREKHENSDRRAQQTLSAVHETLEKVVDRLAMLEEDVQEVRIDARSGYAAPSPAAPYASAPQPPRAQKQKAQDFDAASFLVEPGAGRPKSSAASSVAAEGEGHFDGQNHLNAEAPAIKLSREDEAALLSRSPGSNYIDVARRALAARAEADAFEREDIARQRQGAGGAGGGVAAAAERAKDGAAKFMRPLGAGEKRGGARVGVLLAAGASVLAMGMFQLYRVATAPASPPMQAIGSKAEIAPSPAAPAPGAAAVVAQVPAAALAQVPAAALAQVPAAALAQVPPAAFAQVPAAATQAPAASPADASAQPAVNPARGASLIDPLAVSSIGPRNNDLAAIEAGAQAAALKDQAQQGDAVAQFDLAARFAEGRGVDRNPARAIAWFEKAAAQGQPQAEYRLGVIYEKGLGAARDAHKAQDYYQRAAAQGHVRAMHNLAVVAAEGVDGKPDYATAAQWFRRAADYGVRDSQFNLAILYARGMGVSQNMGLSYVWFSAAANQGDADAAKKRDEIANRLSTSELAAAKKQASAFHARTPVAAVNEAPMAGAPPQASARS